MLLSKLDVFFSKKFFKKHIINAHGDDSRAQIKLQRQNNRQHHPKFTENVQLINIHKLILAFLASGSHFLQLIKTERRKGRTEKKKHLNYITSTDQPTDSRPPGATSASSTNIDRILIFFPTFADTETTNAIFF